MANYFDKYKNVKFNEIIVEDFCEIQNITEPLLTSRDISTLNIPSVDGEIFNGSKKNSYKIEILVLIDCDTQEEYDQNVRELKDTFDVDEPKQFFKDKDKFILAIPDGEIEQLDKNALYSREFKINLFCPEPFYYSENIKVFENEDDDMSKVKVENQGRKPVQPLISIGFSKDAYFAQVELKSTGQKILVGKYPKLSLRSQAYSNRVLYDGCSSVAGFVDSSASIDSDRTGGGTITLTSNGKGVCMNSSGDGETTWKGVCKRLNFDIEKTIDEFELTCNMTHASTGTNGDPTVFKTEKEEIKTGTKETYYQVTAGTTNYRTGPGTNYKVIGTLKKGFEIFRGIETKGWLKFEYNNKTCYVILSRLTRKTKDTTVTTTKKNLVTNQSTPIRSSAKRDSKKLASIPAITPVRCITSKIYKDPDPDEFGKFRQYYKMDKAYKGVKGYVCVGNLVEAGNVSVEYPEGEGYISADEKVGMIELYGFDTNGQKLFVLGMYDDNPWFEYTYPQCKIGNRIILKDNTKVPEPNKKYSTSTNDGGSVIKVTNQFSGKLGNWNDSKVTWNISRKKDGKNYKWDVEVKKIKDGKVVKTQKQENVKYSDLPTEKLSHLVLYIGTTGSMEKSSDMALTHVECYEINPAPEEEVNVTYFKEGDVLEIDTDNDGYNVYLNDTERNDLVDIGSRFFSLGVGEEEINVCSSDDDVSTSVAIREKY